MNGALIMTAAECKCCKKIRFLRNCCALSIALAVLTFGTTLRSFAQSSNLTNPFLNAADPFITRANGSYLLLASCGNSITIWSGSSLVSLPSNPKEVWKPSDSLGEIWSPTLWHVYGGWWIYFTAEYPGRKHGIYALQADTDDPLGNYTFRGQISLAKPAIDPSLLNVNGSTYLMYVDVDPSGWNGVWITALSGPTTPTDQGRLLIFPDQPWERGAGTMHNYPVSEGPTALYHAGKTFIVYSGSDTGTFVYCLGLLTYRGKGDPTQYQNWDKTGPVFKNSSANRVYGPGRGTFTTSADGKQDWIVYHAKATMDYNYGDRSLRAQPFTWTPDGYPLFGTPVPVGTLPSGFAK
jgi:GH43 family beta-xylosidase